MTEHEDLIAEAHEEIETWDMDNGTLIPRLVKALEKVSAERDVLSSLREQMSLRLRYVEGKREQAEAERDEALKEADLSAQERGRLIEERRRVEKWLRMERVAARELLVRAEEAEAGWHALTVVVERVKSVLVHPNRIEEHGEASLRWSIRKAFDILHECTSVVRNTGKSEAEAERDKLAAVVEQVKQWRHDWFNEPIEGVKRKPHHRRLDDVLDAAPSVTLDRVRAEALRDAADGFRLYGDHDYSAVTVVTVENYLNDRADRIEKGESNDQ